MTIESQEQSTEDQLQYDADQEQLQSQGQSPADTAAADASAIATQREATSKGWVAKDKYTGDPAKWVDASTFVERGNNFNKTLQNKVANLESQLGRFKTTADQFKKFHDEAMAAKQSELTAAVAQLKREHREAIRDGDDDAADVIEGRLEVLQEERAKSKAEPAADAPAGPTPELAEWVADGNEWFTTDIKLQSYAVTISQELLAKGETLRGRPFLDKVTQIMKEDFPAKFQNPNRQRPGATESPSAAATSNSAKTERNLPAEDRKLMNDFIAAGWTTKEKFLAEYRW